MNDFVDVRLDLQMWNLQLRDNLQRRGERFVGLFTALFVAKRPAQLPQAAEHLRTIEPLSFAMITECHQSAAPIGWPHRRSPAAKLLSIRYCDCSRAGCNSGIHRSRAMRRASRRSGFAR